MSDSGSSEADGPVSSLALVESLVARRAALVAELDRDLDAAIVAARASGATWPQLATALGGMTKQAASERHANALRRTRERESRAT